MIWKEIRCDSFGKAGNLDCESFENSGPHGFDSIAELRRQARKAGWQTKGGRDVCPNCLKAAAEPIR